MEQEEFETRIGHQAAAEEFILERCRKIGEDLVEKANEYDDDDLRGLARKLLGQHDYVVYCISKGLYINTSDRNYILTHLKED